MQTLNAKWTVVCIGAAAYSADMASAAPTRIDPAVAARRPLRLLERATAKPPTQRHASAAELQAEVNALLDGLSLGGGIVDTIVFATGGAIVLLVVVSLFRRVA